MGGCRATVAKGDDTENALVAKHEKQWRSLNNKPFLAILTALTSRSIPYSKIGEPPAAEIELLRSLRSSQPQNGGFDVEAYLVLSGNGRKEEQVS